jgi:hypothetical protein
VVVVKAMVVWLAVIPRPDIKDARMARFQQAVSVRKAVPLQR